MATGRSALRRGETRLVGGRGPVGRHMGRSLLFPEQMETKHVLEIVRVVPRGRVLAALFLHDGARRAFCSGSNLYILGFH